MCTSKYVEYTGGCKETYFTQCPERFGSNVKCSPVLKEWGMDSNNYCSRHLVKPDAAVKHPPGPVAAPIEEAVEQAVEGAAEV
jgi:hypothetical protein